MRAAPRPGGEGAGRRLRAARRALARLARSAWTGARALVRRVRAFSQGLSLRWKIAAALAGGCALVAVAIGLLIHQARAAQLVTTARESATAQLVRVRQLYELTGQVDQSDADAAVDDGRLPSALRESALAGRRGTFVELDGPDPAVWAARPIGGQVLSVRLPLAAERADLREFDRELVAWGALVVALAALGGAALASRLSRELRTAAATARRISRGELDARIGPSGPDTARNEVAELARAVDTMAASLQRRLEAEQRFTADVAHELRTPLTGLHTAAELLPPSRPTELVRDRVAALRTLTEDLLEVARLDARVERPALEVRPLGDLVEGILRRGGFGVERADVGGDALVRTDPRRLERIVANLVANARRHGASPVEVTVCGTTVTVRDHGPGFPAHVLRDGPRRFVTGSQERGQGSGLGLTIALGQAEVIGARVELRNPPSGGASATVTLPGA
ncbi:HAMP domain-containing sensor histidine kinase [Streptomyces sp. TLI_146]|uniref:sensor histidine kinase n=1 Tax=Streptomyces sp. TLI_146 TaxID=1938858 RepID=UPI000C6FE190|nr:HAMP domain-containing sensor histidine kinase [Streptomyces sp. TLI_146]PKV85600.1 signal transduction histidine kinase [Streptomyces sp. TLI_146]